MTSQWDRLLKNQGTWIGSFTRMTSSGDVLSDVPTEVILQPSGAGDTMRQIIRKHPPGQPQDETILEYRSLGRGVLFCETGAFSQGSLQWSPVSEFGTELGLIHHNERLRMVLTFSRQPQLTQLTLIREHLQGSEPVQRPSLSLDQLIGTWIGEAVTVFPAWQPEQTMATQLTVKSLGEGQIFQTLRFGNSPPLQTQARQMGSALQFEQGQQPVTVRFLPDGAAATFPTEIQPGKPLFLEIGWLIAPHLRQRLIRTYDQRGTLVSQTLVTEQRQN